jgi:carbon monoxide dehydrogenase subunit G
MARSAGGRRQRIIGNRVTTEETSTMRLDLDRRWRIDASPTAGWMLLADTRRLLGCMPGAKVSGRADEHHFDGSLMLKIGAAKLTFSGRLEITSVDAPGRTLLLRGEAADVAGGSKATLELRSRIEPDADADGCSLTGHAEVSVEGKAAVFGAPALHAAAQSLLEQFARRFAEEARLVQGRLPKPVVPAAPAAAEAVPQAEAPASVPAAPAEVLPAPSQPDSTAPALATLWGRLVAWLKGLAGSR